MTSKRQNDEFGMRSSKMYRAVFLSIVIGAGAYFLGAVVSGGQETLNAVSHLGGLGWAVILGLSLVNYSLRFGRWRWYLRKLDYRISVVDDLTSYIAGFALTTTPAKSGEAIRSLYLRKYEVSYEDSIAALFVERLADTAAMAVLATLVIFLAPDVWIYVLLAGILTVAALIAVRNGSLEKLVKKISVRGKSRLASRVLERSHFLFHAATRLTNGNGLIIGFVSGLMAWGAEAYGFYILLLFLEVEISMVIAIGIYAAAILIGAASFVPGGLGTTEAAMGLMLFLSGVDAATAVAATIICRVATLWFAVILGFIAVMFIELTGRSKRVPQT